MWSANCDAMAFFGARGDDERRAPDPRGSEGGEAEERESLARIEAGAIPVDCDGWVREDSNIDYARAARVVRDPDAGGYVGS